MLEILKRQIMQPIFGNGDSIEADWPRVGERRRVQPGGRTKE